MVLEIRKVRTGNVEKLRPLLAAFSLEFGHDTEGTTEFSSYTLDAVMTDPKALYYLMTEDGMPVGFAGGHMHPEWEVSEGPEFDYEPIEGGREFMLSAVLYIRPKFRNRGYGTRFSEHLIEEAKKMGLAGMDGRVVKENETSLKMFRGLGFTEKEYQDQVYFRLDF